jgi:hypothetical protein
MRSCIFLDFTFDTAIFILSYYIIIKFNGAYFPLLNIKCIGTMFDKDNLFSLSRYAYSSRSPPQSEETWSSPQPQLSYSDADFSFRRPRDVERGRYSYSADWGQGERVGSFRVRKRTLRFSALVININ